MGLGSRASAPWGYTEKSETFLSITAVGTRSDLLEPGRNSASCSLEVLQGHSKQPEGSQRGLQCSGVLGVLAGVVREGTRCQQRSWLWLWAEQVPRTAPRGCLAHRVSQSLPTVLASGTCGAALGLAENVGEKAKQNPLGFVSEGKIESVQFLERDWSKPLWKHVVHSSQPQTQKGSFAPQHVLK